MRGKLRQLFIHLDTHPKNVIGNDEHTNKINNIDTDKNSNASNNDMLRNDVNNSDTNSNNFNNNSSENDNVKNIDTENNIDNVKLCYNFKHRQIAHIIKKYGEYLPCAIQSIQVSNTNIY